MPSSLSSFLLLLGLTFAPWKLQLGVPMLRDRLRETDVLYVLCLLVRHIPQVKGEPIIALPIGTIVKRYISSPGARQPIPNRLATTVLPRALHVLLLKIHNRRSPFGIRQESSPTARSSTSEEGEAAEISPPNPQGAAPEEQGRKGVTPGGEGDGITQAEVDEAWGRAREMEVSGGVVCSLYILLMSSAMNELH